MTVTNSQKVVLGLRFLARTRRALKSNVKKIFSQLPTSLYEAEATTMVTVHLEMEPFSGPIDLSKTAVIIIDMQVRIRWTEIKVNGGRFLLEKLLVCS
jgi:hypothetical protein